jgi:hypothetical protein
VTFDLWFKNTFYTSDIVVEQWEYSKCISEQAWDYQQTKLDKALKVIDVLKETSEHYADLANDIVIDYKLTKIEIDELIKELCDE